MLVRLLHPSKTDSSMVVTELGMVIDSKLEQPENMYVPNEVIVWGNDTSLKWLHLMNVSEPMEVTELGMAMVSRSAHSLKAYAAIFVTVLGIEMVVKPSQ